MRGHSGPQWAALAEGLAGPPDKLAATLELDPKKGGWGRHAEDEGIYPLICAVALKRAGEAKAAAARVEQMKGKGTGGWRERLLLRLLADARR